VIRRPLAALLGLGLAAAVLVAAGPAPAGAQDGPAAPDTASISRGDLHVPERGRDPHPRLSPQLEDDLAAAPAGPAGRSAAPASTTTIVLQSRDLAASRAAIAREGGTITDSAGDLLRATVPTASLGRLADDAPTVLVREPYKAQTQAVTSEGVAESGASSWIGAGKDGSGVKVAIVDVGFDGYQAALGSELPASVETDLSRCSGTGGTSHGTGVAEIVHDEAPGAALYLVCAVDDVTFASAVATLGSHGVKVVNGSVGFTIAGRGDGSGGAGSPAAAVAALRRQGILYVASAGNYGTTHFSFPAKGDTDLNAPPEEDLVDIDDNDVLGFAVPLGLDATVSISWDEWPIARTDFDAYVTSDTCSSFYGSDTPQSDTSLPPVEQVEVSTQGCTAANPSDPPSQQFVVFGLGIDRFSGRGTPRMDVWFDGAVIQVEHHNASAITEPASSPAVLAVGAHCVSNGAIEPFSSRGPTIDDRVKPDLTGPDGVSSAVPAYGAAVGTCQGGFLGTSAAAPHVAGAAADLLSANASLDVAELQQLLENRATDSGTAGKDSAFGSGRLRLGTAGSAPPPTPRRFTPITPLRLFDSRPGPLGAAEAAFGASGRTTPIGGDQEVAVQVAGVGGVPTDATAVVLNVTVTEPTAGGWITVHPSGAAPTSSNLNFFPGQTVAVHVTATVGPDQKVRFYNSTGSTHLIVDIAGWYGPTSSGDAGLTRLAAPSRAFDTRSGTPGFAETGPSGRTSPIGADSEVQVQLAGLGGIPAEATAVVVNLTVTDPTWDGWLTLYPTGAARPLASTLNFTPGLTVANLAVVPVGTGGKVTIYNSHGTSDVVLDAIGYLRPGTGAGYVALDPPTRDLDTRYGTGPRHAPLGPNATYKLEVARYYGVPARAEAVMLNVVAVYPSSWGWLTIYPGSGSLPLASNLNFTAGTIVPNAVLSGIGTDGTVAISNANGTTDVVADLAGYFVAG
jgi:hypothetical protein